MTESPYSYPYETWTATGTMGTMDTFTNSVAASVTASVLTCSYEGDTTTESLYTLGSISRTVTDGSVSVTHYPIELSLTVLVYCPYSCQP